FPIYHILFSSLTNGQSAGKLILGIRVVPDTNESTKRKCVLHAKRFFFLRGGTKVVKEIDPSVKGLS
ncbi:MAG: RDD family protein, partial [Candidatus Hodarchaeales archaeon]